MDKKQLQESVCRVMKQGKTKFTAWAKEIASKPELGHKESRMADFIRGAFGGLGLPTPSGIAAPAEGNPIIR